ncbi:MAG: hypothetical protein KC680_03060 [Candidatus Peregrinibacteria bacterium]|nr:hypothetical protein [Candidatus Peregrinibacteria bacterium]MCB9808748.1 hypothetical protein [Candidatus Peribacteria bacterium]
MKNLLPLTTLSILLTACSIDIVSSVPTIEDIPLHKQASLPGITCILQGTIPHISNLDSKQVEVNINSKIDAYIRTTELSNAACPKQLLDLTEDDATLNDTTTVDYAVGMLENDIFSVKLMESQYFDGAAHPNNSVTTFTFSLIDGQPITLKMLFPDEQDFPTFLKQHINDALAAEGIDETYPSDMTNETVKYYLTPDAVVLTDIFTIHALQGFEVAIPVVLPST